MQTFFSQNRNIILVSLGVFIASMSGLMFFLNNGGSEVSMMKDLKTNVIESSWAGKENAEDTEYRELFKNEEDPFLLLHLDGSIRYVSANFSESTGLGTADLEEKTYFSFINHEDLPIVLSAFSKTLGDADTQTMVGPFRMLDGDGEFRIYMGSFHPVIEDDDVAAVGAVIHDISKALIEKESEDESDMPARTKTTNTRKVRYTRTDTSDNSKSIGAESERINGENDDDSGFNAKAVKQKSVREDAKWIMSYHPAF